MEEIEVSVIMPCLNEEETVGVCVKKALVSLERLNKRGEVIVIDNGSKDNSVEIACKAGAKVIFEPEKGYGSALLRGFKEARGKFIIMGDADDTYDFSQIDRFLNLLYEGFDFVIGSRFKGRIHKGAMSWSHRFIGNPILSGICRLFFHHQFSDVHCGMRAITKEAYQKLNLQTKGMEFASEMIVIALREGLKIKEISIDYYLRKGVSKLRSFKDAWRHLRFMLLFSPNYLFLLPGGILFILGLLLLFFLLPGPFVIFGRRWDIHLMIVGSLSAILGFQILSLGFYAKTYSLLEGFLKEDRLICFLQSHFNLEKGIFLGLFFFLMGLCINLYILLEWIMKRFGALDRVRLTLVGVTFLIIGVQIIFSSFFLSILGLKKR